MRSATIASFPLLHSGAVLQIRVMQARQHAVGQLLLLQSNQISNLDVSLAQALHLCRAAFADAKLFKVSQPGRHRPYSAQQLHAEWCYLSAFLM